MLGGMMLRIESLAAPELIRLEQVGKFYGEGDLAVTALRDLNLLIRQGEYCSIMGASGSGKSTIMHVIGCLDRPNQGHYYLERQAIDQLHDDDLADIRNRKIGFVFQQFYLLPQLSALENVILPMAYAGLSHSERRERAAVALDRVGLSQRVYNRPNQLSGGQQQRVAIARAIINQPLLLLADEPTGALDSRTSQEVMEIFQQLNDEGMTIVMVTHDSDTAQRSQRVIWVQDGEIIDSEMTQAEFKQHKAGKIQMPRNDRFVNN
jgi:putative ABC transport system ATP-binding protein